MTEAALLDIARSAIFTMMLVGAPPLLTALLVGLAVSIVQTVTQVQEATLTFVPKVMLIFASLVVFLPFMLGTMNDFWRTVLDKVIAGGAAG